MTNYKCSAGQTSTRSLGSYCHNSLQTKEMKRKDLEGLRTLISNIYVHSYLCASFSFSDSYLYVYFFHESSLISLYILFRTRFETVDLTTRLLIPIIVLQNHNRYNILQAGHNYSIDIQTIEREVSKIFYSIQYISSHTECSSNKLSFKGQVISRAWFIHVSQGTSNSPLRSDTETLCSECK